MNFLRQSSWLFVAAIFVALLALRSIAADAPTAAAPPVDDGPILPYLDEGTLVVVRLDVERVDQEALAKYAEQSIDAVFKVTPIPANQQAMKYFTRRFDYCKGDHTR